jgi:hypothetical protein
VIAACATSHAVTTIKVAAIANNPSTKVPTSGRHHRCPGVRANRWYGVPAGATSNGRLTG